MCADAGAVVDLCVAVSESVGGRELAYRSRGIHCFPHRFAMPEARVRAIRFAD
jgi:hypothetical protein